MYEKISNQKSRLEIISSIKEKIFQEIEYFINNQIQYLCTQIVSLPKNEIIAILEGIAVTRKIEKIFNTFDFMGYYNKYDDFDKIEYIASIEQLKIMEAEKSLLSIIQIEFDLDIFSIQNEKEFVDCLFEAIGTNSCWDEFEKELSK